MDVNVDININHEGRLKRSFFEKNTVEVAKKLLGKYIYFNHHLAIITETEAYRGIDDPASHAHKGPTGRSEIMFGKPGKVYVYLIYGVHHCLNFVAESEGSPGAVLIRSIHLLQPYSVLLDGPGKLCKVLGITRAHNAVDLASDTSFYVLPGIRVHSIEQTSRIGISKATEKLWRFRILY